MEGNGKRRLTSTLTPSFSLEGVPAPSSAVVVIWEMLDLRGMVRASWSEVRGGIGWKVWKGYRC